MKVTQFLLPFLIALVACCVPAGAKKNGARGGGSANKKPAATPKGSGDTPTPSPAALPDHHEGPAFAAMPPPAAAPDAMVPANPTYQDLLNTFAGEATWAEELPIVLDAKNDAPAKDNTEHSPIHHWNQIWPQLQRLDPATLDSLMKFIFTADVGECAFGHCVERMLDHDVQQRTANARKAAVHVLSKECQKIEKEFAARTPKGKAQMLETCRNTFNEKLEIDLKNSAEAFKNRSFLKAADTNKRSHLFANPDEFEDEAPDVRDGILAGGGALVAYLQSKKKKREEDDEDEDDGKPRAPKRQKKDHSGDKGSEDGESL